MMQVSAKAQTTLAWSRAEVVTAAEPVSKKAGWYPVKKPVTLTWTIQVEAPGDTVISMAYSEAIDAAAGWCDHML